MSMGPMVSRPLRRNGVGAGDEGPGGAGAGLEYGVRQAGVIGNRGRVLQGDFVCSSFFERDAVLDWNQTMRRIRDQGRGAIAQLKGLYIPPILGAIILGNKEDERTGCAGIFEARSIFYFYSTAGKSV